MEVRKGGLFRAQTVIVAGFGRASFVTAMLTLGTTKSFQAGASCTPDSNGTATSIVAGQLPARHAPFTVGPRITLKMVII